VADLVMGSPEFGVGDLSAVGATYVVFGGGENGSAVDLNSLDGHNGVVFLGTAGSRSGYSVAAGGDFNGDGIGDLIIGAYAGPNPAAYVVFGTAAGFDSSSFDLASLDGVNGFTIDGAHDTLHGSDHLGASVAFAGDVNGDGFDDLIVGAPYTFGVEEEAGAAYVIFGRASGLGSALGVTALNGGNGFVLSASHYGDAGHAVSAAGDVNGDGFADLLVGAFDYGETYEGATYVFFGRDFTGAAGIMGTAGEDNLTVGAHGVVHAGASADGIVATGAPDFVDGGTGLDTLNLDAAGASLHLGRVAGIEVIDLVGTHANHLVLDKADVLNASDTTNTLRVTGDSGTDSVTLSGNWKIEAHGDDFQTWTNGRATLEVQRTLAVNVIPDAPDLLALDGANGFRIFGEGSLHSLGYSVSFAGDVNGDGLDDLIVGAPGFGAYAGRAYVVYGNVNYFAPEIEASGINGTLSFDLTGSAAPQVAGRAVSDAGDVNGDGVGDFLVGAPLGSGGERDSAYLVFGKDGALDANIVLSALDGADGVRFGANFDEAIGSALAAAGDVNGDGFDDFIIGARYSSGNAGGAYVVFGTDAALPAEFNLASLAGAGGYIISGEDVGSLTGRVVAAGDFNGDGFSDLILGASSYGESNEGAAYVVFGKQNGFSNVALSTLDGTQGFRLVGQATEGYAGKAVAMADFNGDGRDDLIIGAPYAAESNGTVYVVFGTNASHLASASLSGIGGTNGFSITGEGNSDNLGKSVANAGDVNGDGLDDLIISSNGGNPSAYVIFGKASGMGSSFDLSSLDGHNGFKLAGNPSTGVVFSVAGGGDLNGDGFDDLLVGSIDGHPHGLTNAGTTYVVFGGNFSGAVDMLGTAHDDALIGSAAGNLIIGGQGNDTMQGRGGNDTLVGASGEDDFIFNTAPNNSTNHDVIRDFQSGVDHILLDRSVFTAFTDQGTVIEESVQVGLESEITETSGDGGDDEYEDYLKYATDTGNLYYDSNAKTSGGLVLIATVLDGNGHPAALHFNPTLDIYISNGS
jgi:Ca2+-binding RTX toxin-like protein